MKNEDRNKLKCAFYDITDFFIKFGEFLGLPEDKQNSGFDQENVYRHHPNTEPFPTAGFIKPAEEDWVPFDPTMTLGGQLTAQQRELALQTEAEQTGRNVYQTDEPLQEELALDPFQL